MLSNNIQCFFQSECSDYKRVQLFNRKEIIDKIYTDYKRKFLLLFVYFIISYVTPLDFTENI